VGVVSSGEIPEGLTCEVLQSFVKVQDFFAMAVDIRVAGEAVDDVELIFGFRAPHSGCYDLPQYISGFSRGFTV